MGYKKSDLLCSMETDKKRVNFILKKRFFQGKIIISISLEDSANNFLYNFFKLCEISQSYNFFRIFVKSYLQLIYTF